MVSGGTTGEDAVDDATWRAGPSSAGAHMVARMLQRHGVGALVWSDGEVLWANRAALDLVVEEELAEDEPALLRRLARSLAQPGVLADVAPGEERDLILELATTRALLQLSAVALRANDTERRDVLVTFRAPLERSVDPDHTARLEAMLDAASDVITVIDHEGRVRFSNPAAGRITGLYGSEANGAHMFEFVHPEDHDQVLLAFERGVLAGEAVPPFVIRMRMGDGGWRHMEVTVAGAVAVDDAEGRVVSLRDVTDRHRRDAEAESHRRRLESLVENIDDVIVILGPDLSVTWTSPGIERFVDAPAYTNVGESAFNDMHPDDLEGVLAAISEAMAEPDGRSRTTLRLNHQRFGWRWVEAAVVNRLDDPDVEGLVCTLRDITDERDEAGELARLRHQDRDEMSRLREADRLKDRFLATVSHELRTPLTAVRGFGEVLKQQWGAIDEAERRQLLERIVVNASVMEAMIEQLLDYSRLQAGRVEVQLAPLDLDEAVADMVDALELQLSAHEVVVRTGGVHVVADRFAFGHVMRNLLTNAAKYSRAGTKIEVEAERDGDVVRIHVRDEGIGIAPEDQSRVFQSFFQSAPALSDVRGTGVGLNVARRYAQLQGGTIDLVSEVDVGSTFTFTLPAADT
ncbi:MAG: ATP-binding protein [Acidimicrobiia bacterium]